MELLLKPGEAVDLSNCDREPIHLSGAIQPQGCLLAFDPNTFQLVQWSENLPAVVNIPADLLTTKFLGDLVDSETVSLLQQLAQNSVEGVGRALAVRWQTRESQRSCFAVAHLYQKVLILEVELAALSDVPFVASLGPGTGTIPQFLQHASAEMQACQQLNDLYGLIARLIRGVSGFDRVMVYRFLEDAHGEVVGEAVGEQFESFLGLHYPASDIPPQARRLYELNPLRSIANLNSAPVVITPQRSPLHGAPLDLTYSVFRSVSPIHIEYLRNMGVAASMSISILQGGKLWGLIACHHFQPRYLPLELRITCELFGTMAGSYLTSRSIAEESQQKSARRDALTDALKSVASGGSLEAGLRAAGKKLLSVMDASGLAICIGKHVTVEGATPNLSQVNLIRQALEARAQGHVFSTDSLSAVTELPPESVRVASGALFSWINQATGDSLIFFRPEYRHTVKWGGNPHASRVENPGGQHLSPRRSFAVWQETVQQKSRAWTATDHSIAEELYGGLNVLAARRTHELQRINEELMRLNADLDSFAFAASHDLREPLRGAHLLIYMLEQDLGEDLAAKVRTRLDNLKQSMGRMDTLVEALLRLARAGRRDLELEMVPVAEIVNEAAEIAFGRRDSRTNIELTIGDLPEMQVDFMCMREIFTNLFTNAVKYCESPVKRIDVQYRPLTEADLAPPSASGEYVFSVKDNGIGIAREHFESVFDIFRRLHLRDEFGGGAGVGLAIVRKVVERHGGVMWVRSEPGSGSEFLFTLPGGENIE